MTSITKRDIFEQLSGIQPAIEIDPDGPAYYLHYNADVDALSSTGDGCETFVSKLHTDDAPEFYPEITDELERELGMDYFYRAEVKENPAFMAVVDDLYTQLIRWAEEEAE